MELSTPSTATRPERVEPSRSAAAPFLEGLGVMVGVVAVAFCPNVRQTPARAALPPDGRLQNYLGTWTATGITQRPGRDESLRLMCTGSWLVQNRMLSLSYRDSAGLCVLEQWLSYNEERQQWVCQTYAGRRRSLVPAWSMPRREGHTLHLLSNLPNSFNGAPETLHTTLTPNGQDSFRLTWAILASDGTLRPILRLDHLKMSARSRRR